MISPSKPPFLVPETQSFPLTTAQNSEKRKHLSGLPVPEALAKHTTLRPPKDWKTHRENHRKMVI